MTPNNAKLEAITAATTKDKLEAPKDLPLSASVSKKAQNCLLLLIEFEGEMWLRQVHWPPGLVQMLGAVIVGAGELVGEIVGYSNPISINEM